MPDLVKVAIVALLICLSGFFAAHNAKWIRDGVSPWWTGYFFSFINATIYAYLARKAFFSLSYTNAFQTFFFHGTLFLTFVFILNDPISRHQMVGLALVMAGMVLMSIR